MGLRLLAWVIFILMVLAYGSGCSARVPGDGRLVLVLVDDGLASATLATTGDDGITTYDLSIGAAVRQGARYWDAYGAKLRAPEDALPEDGEPAATIRVVQASAVEELFDESSSWYSTEDGNVHVPIDRLSAMTNGGRAFRNHQLPAMYAHELGHALGLMHVANPDAVMYHVGAPDAALTDADKAEFCKTAIFAAGECLRERAK